MVEIFARLATKLPLAVSPSSGTISVRLAADPLDAAAVTNVYLVVMAETDVSKPGLHDCHRMLWFAPEGPTRTDWRRSATFGRRASPSAAAVSWVLER